MVTVMWSRWWQCSGAQKLLYETNSLNMLVSLYDSTAEQRQLLSENKRGRHFKNSRIPGPFLGLGFNAKTRTVLAWNIQMWHEMIFNRQLFKQIDRRVIQFLCNFRQTMTFSITLIKCYLFDVIRRAMQRRARSKLQLEFSFITPKNELNDKAIPAIKRWLDKRLGKLLLTLAQRFPQSLFGKKVRSISKIAFVGVNFWKLLAAATRRKVRVYLWESESMIACTLNATWMRICACARRRVRVCIRVHVMCKVAEWRREFRRFSTSDFIFFLWERNAVKPE